MRLRHEQQYWGRFAFGKAVYCIITTAYVVGKAPFMSGTRVPAVRVATRRLLMEGVLLCLFQLLANTAEK